MRNATRAKDFLGVPIERHETIGSTNDEAFRRVADGAPEGLVVVAGTQTSGRGRQGRLWWDAPGLSLSFSILLRPGLLLPQYPLLAIAMACATADAGGDIAAAQLDVKWPNDVMHASRKLCGVLAESRVSGGAGSAGGPAVAAAPLVIGVGVNVNQIEEDFPRELRGAATSLRLVRGAPAEPISLETVLASILARFEPFVRMGQRGAAAELHAAVAPRLPKPGVEVSIRSGDRRIDGIVEGLTETAALRVRERDRAEATVVSAGELQ